MSEAQFRVIDDGTDDEVYELAKADTRVLDRLGNPTQRRAALQILMQSMGLPARMLDDDPGIYGQLTKAVQYVGEYGFMPGEHFHAVPRKTKIDGPNGKPQFVETVSIQLGEKAWKASAMRHGIEYEIQYKPMTREELKEYCESIGAPFTGDRKVSPHSVGYYARVITKRMVDWGLVTPDSPVWGAGVWIGVIRQGRSWWDDNLPTGVDPSAVAQRRATKRALMQSSLTLIPLDDRPQPERYEALAVGLKEQAEQKEADGRAGLYTPIRATADENGDLLFASDEPKPPPPVESDDLPESLDDVDELPFDTGVTWQSWTKPAEAQAWAVEGGYCSNEYHARGRFAKVVKAEVNGKLTNANAAKVYKAFYDRCISGEDEAEQAQEVAA